VGKSMSALVCVDVDVDVCMCSMGRVRGWVCLQAAPAEHVWLG